MSLENKTGKAYVSHSALSTWLQCGWQFYLSRIQMVPQAPAWWFAGGKAVHEATEEYDLKYFGTELEASFDPAEAFEEAFIRNFQADDNGMEWRTGGRASKAYPNREDRAWWMEHGPRMVDSWTVFRKLSGYELYVTPEGVAAIELEMNEKVNGVPVKAILDRLMVAPTGELVIVDIKSGAKEPAGNTQLGIYAVMVEKTLGVRPQLGAYFLARTGELTTPVNLEHYTENRFGQWVKGFEVAVKNNLYIPSVGFMCGTCAVKDACYAVKGKDSASYPEITVGEVSE